MTDGRGIPVAIGEIQSGNHNDLYQVVPQFSSMITSLNSCGIVVQNSILDADKGFDSIFGMPPKRLDFQMLLYPLEKQL